MRVSRRCGPHSCAARRRPTTPVPRAQFEQPFFRILCPQTLHCPAARRGPTSFLPIASGVAGRATLQACRVPCHIARIAPVLRLATIRSGLLRRAMKSNYARVYVPNSQHRCPVSLPANAALPGRPLWPHVFLARRQRHRRALPRALRSKLAAGRATLRASRAPRFGFAACNDASSTTAPRHDVQLNSRVAYPIRKPFFSFSAVKCFVARPPAVDLPLARRCQQRRGALPRATL